MKDDIRDIVRRFLMKEKIKDLKRKQRDMELRYAIRQAKEHQAELEKRFNHNHDPKNGRFTSGLTSSGQNGTLNSNGMYRKSGNAGVFAHLPEKMSKKHIRDVAVKFGIDTRGIEIEIKNDPELLELPYAGLAAPEKIGLILFFPNAFKSEEELARTIFHEAIHVRQFKKYGSDYVQNHRNRFEDEAEAEETKFISRCRKAGLL